MVAVGAPRLSIGCYSVPQQTGSVASAAAILCPWLSDESWWGFVEGVHECYVSGAGRIEAQRPRCCSTHQPLFFLDLIASSVLPRLAEGCFVPKNEASSFDFC